MIKLKKITIVKSTANKSSRNSFVESKTYTDEYEQGHGYDKKQQRQVCEICCLRCFLLSKVTRKSHAETASVKFWLA